MKEGKVVHLLKTSVPCYHFIFICYVGLKTDNRYIGKLVCINQGSASVIPGTLFSSFNHSFTLTGSDNEDEESIPCHHRKLSPQVCSVDNIFVLPCKL